MNHLHHGPTCRGRRGTLNHPHFFLHKTNLNLLLCSVQTDLKGMTFDHTGEWGYLGRSGQPGTVPNILVMPLWWLHQWNTPFIDYTLPSFPLKLQHNFIYSLFSNSRPFEGMNMCAVPPWPGFNQGRQFQIIEMCGSSVPPGWGIIDYLT